MGISDTECHDACLVNKATLRGHLADTSMGTRLFENETAKTEVSLHDWNIT